MKIKELTKEGVSMLNIKELRKSKRISILKLSKITGISRSYLNELDNNKYDNPGLKVICTLCKAFNCTPNDIIPEELYREDKK